MNHNTKRLRLAVLGAGAIVLFLAIWLNPQAGVSVIFALKLCFQLLETLHDHHCK